METLAFTKMHGLGNDFVVIDERSLSQPLTPDHIRAIADRRRGIGCDQLILLEAPRSEQAMLYMRIMNADGGEVEACGNATRCVADMLMSKNKTTNVTVETTVGILSATRAENNRITVDMGPASDAWDAIPLSREVDTLSLDISVGPLANPTAVSVGNPHAVFFVEDPEAVDLAKFGPEIEHHDLFPNRTNVEAAALVGPDEIRLRVWERGVGITQACGTGACATLVAAARRGLTGRKGDVHLDGGTLTIEWLENGHVLMTGPATTVYSGELDLGSLS